MIASHGIPNYRKLRDHFNEGLLDNAVSLDMEAITNIGDSSAYINQIELGIYDPRNGGSSTLQDIVGGKLSPEEIAVHERIDPFHITRVAAKRNAPRTSARSYNPRVPADPLGTSGLRKLMADEGMGHVGVWNLQFEGRALAQADNWDDSLGHYGTRPGQSAKDAITGRGKVVGMNDKLAAQQMRMDAAQWEALGGDVTQKIKAQNLTIQMGKDIVSEVSKPVAAGGGMVFDEAIIGQAFIAKLEQQGHLKTFPGSYQLGTSIESMTNAFRDAGLWEVLGEAHIADMDSAQGHEITNFMASYINADDDAVAALGAKIGPAMDKRRVYRAGQIAKEKGMALGYTNFDAGTYSYGNDTIEVTGSKVVGRTKVAERVAELATAQGVDTPELQSVLMAGFSNPKPAGTEVQAKIRKEINALTNMGKSEIPAQKTADKVLQETAEATAQKTAEATAEATAQKTAQETAGKVLQETAEATAEAAAEAAERSLFDLTADWVGRSPINRGVIPGATLAAALLTWHLMTGMHPPAQIDGIDRSCDDPSDFNSRRALFNNVSMRLAEALGGRQGVNDALKLAGIVGAAGIHTCGRLITKSIRSRVTPTTYEWGRASQYGVEGKYMRGSVSKDYDTGMDSAGLQIVGSGDKIHAAIQEAMMASNPNVISEYAIRDTEEKMTGHIDMLIPTQVGSGQVAYIPTEIKSINDRGFANLRGGPKEGHRAQAQFYLHHLAKKAKREDRVAPDYERFIYVNRANPKDYKEFVIQRNEKEYQFYKKRFNKYRKELKNSGARPKIMGNHLNIIREIAEQEVTIRKNALTSSDSVAVTPQQTRAMIEDAMGRTYGIKKHHNFEDFDSPVKPVWTKPSAQVARKGTQKFKTAKSPLKVRPEVSPKRRRSAKYGPTLQLRAERLQSRETTFSRLNGGVMV